MLLMNERDFRRLDLNLLVVLGALMRERSTTRAAEKLFLGQPAVSMALRRLREQWGDALFVRGRNGLEPTAAAVELWSRVAPALDAIGAAHAGGDGFDPARIDRTLRLGMPDDFEAYLLPRLLGATHVQAPGLRLALRGADTYALAGMLERDEIDLAIGVPEGRPAWIVCKLLLRTRLLCVYDARRMKLKAPLTRRQFVSLPHLLVTFNGELSGRIDTALAALNLKRRVIAGGSHFLAVGLTLKRADAIACMPEPVARLLADDFGLATCPPPLPVPEFEVATLRHRRSQRDAALDWMEGLIRAQLRPLDRSPRRRTHRGQEPPGAAL
jgi:LysR family transcriptional regulator, mexEF-oprN operon transcriptional activator